MDTADIQRTVDLAIAGLAGNSVPLPEYDRPVLIEGQGYGGIWMECGPLEALVYAQRVEGKLAVAKASHEVFFDLQKDDGQLPFGVSAKRKGDLGFGQIQMVVPIAKTAWETVELLEQEGEEAEGFLAKAYAACSRWDDWLVRYRNTRGTGLCELFCEFDSGHDGSPRFDLEFLGLGEGRIPGPCPDGDARRCPDIELLPYLAPDLSATVFGARTSLSKMAERLGKSGESQQWLDKAEATRAALMKHCWHPDDECFYDVDAKGNFVRIRGDILTRVFSEHVVDQAMFDRIYERHIKDPEAFWTPYPLPSIAANDPAFVKSMHKNCWGGPSQSLTALRAPRWFDHYDKHDDLEHMMRQWVEAIVRAGEFQQQMNPWTGEFSTSKQYSPAMCVLLDYVARLGLLEGKTRFSESR